MSDQPENAGATGLTKWHLFWIAYVVIAIGFTIYESHWGPERYRGFFYNFGASLVWPFILFPVLGKIVGGILILGIVVWALSSNRTS